MAISPDMSDDAVLETLGHRLKQRRLDLRLTQAELAEQAGIGKRTVERLENGASVQLASLVRIFRVLGLMPALDELLPQGGPRPMDLLRLQGKQRQRASSSSAHDGGDKNWEWGDEE
jgi:transcriptional regulator with XRE-family HTH domain